MNARVLPIAAASALLAAAPTAAEPVNPVEIREWAVPWEESRPRDPYVANDGRVWFVGQRGHYVANFSPETGQFNRYDLDPGTGLLDAVGPDGRVVSFERRADHLDIARANVAAWHGVEPDQWEPRHGDVTVGLREATAHRVVLDLLEPWVVVAAAAEALSPGGIMVAYMPTVTQVMRFDRACTDSGLFADVRTSESLDRGWDVDNLAVRPHHRMVAHTAFLTTARRVPPPEDGGPDRPRPTTGPTVVFSDTRDLSRGDGAPGDLPRLAGDDATTPAGDD